MRFNRTVVVTFGLLIACAVVAWRYAPFGGSAAKAQPPPPIPVTAATAATRNVPVYVEGLGSVQAFNTVAVKTRVDGQITKVFFREGQEVKAGDSLFQIDPRPFENALQLAQATKEKDEAQLHSAQLDLERTAKLLTQSFQTQQAYDQQKATVGQLQASLKADDAQIATAQLNIDYSLVKAPIDGRTGARQVDIGNLVQAAQNASLVSITQMRPIFVSFTAPATRLDDIRRNQAKQPLKVVACAQDDKTELAQGELTLIDNLVDVATGTIRLKAQFDNAGEPLWPGEFISARIVLATREDAVTVPQDAVMQGPTGSYVYVLDNDDTAHRRAVEVAATQEGIAVVGKGLNAGERIVLEGQYRLIDGAKAKVGAPQQAELGGLVPRTRSSHDFAAGTVANFGFKSGTSIIELLVSFSIPKFAQKSRQMLANFGIGALAAQ
jgi:multidrug efflux system membrane fusion protein